MSHSSREMNGVNFQLGTVALVYSWIAWRSEQELNLLSHSLLLALAWPWNGSCFPVYAGGAHPSLITGGFIWLSGDAWAVQSRANPASLGLHCWWPQLMNFRQIHRCHSIHFKHWVQDEVTHWKCLMSFLQEKDFRWLIRSSVLQVNSIFCLWTEILLGRL